MLCPLLAVSRAAGARPAAALFFSALVFAGGAVLMDQDPLPVLCTSFVSAACAVLAASATSDAEEMQVNIPSELDVFDQRLQESPKLLADLLQ